MTGAFIKIYGLSFQSALVVCSEFKDYELLDKQRKFFRDGEVSISLPHGTYRITSVDDRTCIEELICTGTNTWERNRMVVIATNSYSRIEIS